MASRKVFPFLVLALCLITVTAHAFQASLTIPSKGTIGSSLAIAPDFAATDIDGNAIVLSGLRGNVVVLDFMTKWCGACWVKIDGVLIPFWNEYKSKAVVMISICWEASAQELIELRQQHPGMDWYAISDPDASFIKSLYPISVTPTVIVVDKVGCIRTEGLPSYSPNLTLEQLKNCVDGLLAE